MLVLPHLTHNYSINIAENDYSCPYITLTNSNQFTILRQQYELVQAINSWRLEQGYPNLNSNWITSVMIYHRGASLSEQHTDLLICHCIKQNLSRTSRYLGITYKPTARTATVSMATYAWTKLYTKVMSWISDIYKCRLCMPLPEVTLTTVVIEICTACGQAAVDEL